MERTEILEKVRDIASDVLGVDADEITEETTFDDLDADSLDRLQLVTAMEDESAMNSRTTTCSGALSPIPRPWKGNPSRPATSALSS